MFTFHHAAFHFLARKNIPDLRGFFLFLYEIFDILCFFLKCWSKDKCLA